MKVDILIPAQGGCLWIQTCASFSSVRVRRSDLGVLQNSLRSLRILKKKSDPGSGRVWYEETKRHGWRFWVPSNTPPAVSRWLKGVRKSSLVFWKGLIALSNISSTDVSSCLLSSLSRPEPFFDCSARDKEETWQEETSVELMLQSAMRPFQNTKELSLTPFSYRDTAGGLIGGNPESPSMLLCLPISDPSRPGVGFFFNILEDLNEFCKTPKSERLTRTEKKVAQVWIHNPPLVQVLKYLPSYIYMSAPRSLCALMSIFCKKKGVFLMEH